MNVFYDTFLLFSLFCKHDEPVKGYRLNGCDYGALLIDGNSMKFILKMDEAGGGKVNLYKDLLSKEINWIFTWV